MTAKKANDVSSASSDRAKAESVKKKTTRKAAVKKAPKKKVTPKKVATDVGSTKASAEKREDVALPTNMSQRSIEKSLVLKREFDHLYRNYVAQLAKVVSICFVLVGAALIFSELAPIPQQPMVAQLASTTSALIQPTTILVTSTIPPVVTSDTIVKFTANNALNVKAKVRQLGMQGFHDLPTTKIQGDNYEATIWWASLPVGYYELFIYAVPQDQSGAVTYKSTAFHIGQLPTTQTTTQTQTTNTATPTTTTSTSGGSTSGTTQTSGTTGTTQTTQTTQTTTNTATDPIDSTVSGSVVQTSGGTDNTLDTSIQIPFAVFTTDDNVLTGTEIIGVSTPDDYSYIELYARPINSVNSRFITLATKRSVHWQFIVNSENIPNGDYEFYAQTKHNNSVLTSKSIRLRVSNAATTVSAPTYTPQPVTTTASSPTVETPTYERPLYVVTEDTRSTASSSEQLLSDVDREARDLLRTSDRDFTELFNRYATAQQSGDEEMIRLADEAIREQRERLADTALYDPRLQDIADNIDSELATKVENIKRRIESFETVRREKSGGDTAKDTDGDGISDADEIALYKTDPTAADSDNDGVNDGIEIIRGFNPNDAAGEAVIRFESPKETVGLTRADSLSIVEVTPIQALQSPDEPKPANKVATEIRGKALPNSFVTLYIFSTPIVVTVKTDADGSFVYTFDRELEDGRHDVYAAVTDNTGEIIAQSNPFSFVKEAQAFTPVDAAESEVVSGQTVAETTGGSYGLVIGVAILALGLILLMLGVSLRSKDDEIVITETPKTPQVT